MANKALDCNKVLWTEQGTLICILGFQGTAKQAEKPGREWQKIPNDNNRCIGSRNKKTVYIMERVLTTAGGRLLHTECRAGRY